MWNPKIQTFMYKSDRYDITSYMISKSFSSHQTKHNTSNVHTTNNNNKTNLIKS
ncbi:hypothetical protein Sjap_023870 [Stephania japonica]|uniref:Uncharacterized protein n=1 Tax=Stephania japonica TaxID=461633 RepID=A0AAP0EHP2_9MAGN